MRLNRRPKRWLCGWLTVVLLTLQFATAAYACPRLAVPDAPPAAAALPMADMPGCAGHRAAAMDPDQPQLCQAHCQQGSQGLHPTPATDAPATPVLLAVLDWSAAAQGLALPVLAASGTPQVASGAPPPGAPPLYLSLLVLRN